MKKLSNEIRIGILSLVGMAVLIFGFFFLKGKNLLNNQKKIFAIFNSIEGALEKSNSVKMNGVIVGSVYSIEPNDKNVDKVKVAIIMTKDVNIPTNSVAYIESGIAGIGTSSIIIEKGNASTYIEDDGTIQTRQEPGMLSALSAQFTPTLAKVGSTLDSLALVLSSVNSILDAGNQQNLKATLANFNTASKNLSNTIASIQNPLNNTMDNVSTLTSDLKVSVKKTDEILANAQVFSEKLTKIDLQKLETELTQTITQVKSAIAQLTDPSGTLGALAKDKTLYNKLNDVLLGAEILLDDVRTHPKRYVNISVFGKKDKSGALQAPLIKDSIPKSAE